MPGHCEWVMTSYITARPWATNTVEETELAGKTHRPRAF